jgi:hypothetical protein
MDARLASRRQRQVDSGGFAYIRQARGDQVRRIPDFEIIVMAARKVVVYSR